MKQTSLPPKTLLNKMEPGGFLLALLSLILLPIMMHYALQLLFVSLIAQRVARAVEAAPPLKHIPTES